MKNLNEIKEEVAKSYGMTWQQIIQDRGLFDSTVDTVAKRYAEEEAIAFAEWKEECGWEQDFMAEHTHSTEELYQLFKKSLQ